MYQNAKAFIYPSLYEGFGLPLLEAMANNCPIITSKTSSIPEVVGEAAKYFNPLSTDDIIYAIESVVYSDSIADKLISLGKEKIKSFSWKQCAINTERVYHELL